jgi:acetyltransferase
MKAVCIEHADTPKVGISRIGAIILERQAGEVHATPLKRPSPRTPIQAVACFVRCARWAMMSRLARGQTVIHAQMDVAPGNSIQLPTSGPSPVRALYPVRARLRDETDIVIRPIGPEDAEREQDFVRALSPESRYFRFMTTLRELPPDMLYRFTHPDFQRELALAAVAADGASAKFIGVARCVADSERTSAEFAVVVADEWQNRGVGTRLLCELMRAARAIGLRRIWGDVLASNMRMLGLMVSLGFEIQPAPDDLLLRRVVKLF